MDDFGPAVPDFQFVLQSRDHRFKMSKELVKDLMTPGFLNGVGDLDLACLPVTS